MEPEEQEERDTFVPESARLILVPALKFGALCGSSGLLYGTFAGPFRSITPGLFVLASGIEFFTLGSTFWATRGAIIRFHYPPAPTPKDHLHASTIAGGITGGAILGLTRGRHTIVPGTLMMALLGWAGQSVYNRMDARHTQSVLAPAPDANSPSFWHSLASRKYSPMKVLSDAEYEAMLREKLLRVDADIALVEEKIARLKVESGMKRGRGAMHEEKGEK